MKRLASRIALGLAAVLTAALPALGADKVQDRVYEMASMLSGTFEGSTPGNQVTVDISSVVVDPQHPFDLFARITGRYQNTNVFQQGLIRLEAQGADVYFTYIPHFNPAVTALSQDAGRFTERELTSACSFVLNPKGDGFIGDTLGNTSCSLAIRGAIGKWSLEFEPGTLKVQQVDTGETLRFRLITKREIKR